VRSRPCPLYPQKQTLELGREMSAICQKPLLPSAAASLVKIWWLLSSDYSANSAVIIIRAFSFCRNGQPRNCVLMCMSGATSTGGKHDHREKACDSRVTRRWHFAVNGAKRSADRRLPAYSRRRRRQSRYVWTARTWLRSGSVRTDISIHSTESLSPVGGPADGNRRSAHRGSTQASQEHVHVDSVDKVPQRLEADSSQ